MINVVSVEELVRKYKYYLMMAIISLVLYATNPYGSWVEASYEESNVLRVEIDSILKNYDDSKDKETLRTKLVKLSKENSKLFSLVLTKSSFKDNLMKIIEKDKLFLKEIKDPFKTIVEIEIAVQNKDLKKLTLIKDSVKEKTIKDYLVFVIKTIDSKSDLEFEKESIFKRIYIK